MGDSGEWRKIVAYAASTGVPFRVVSTYRPGAITATGHVSRHSLGLAVDLAGHTASRDSDQLLAINLAFKPVAHLLHELIYSGPGSYQIYNGAPHYFQGVTRDNHHDHVHVSIDYGVVFPAPDTPEHKPEEEDVPTGSGIINPGGQAVILFPLAEGGWDTALRLGSQADGADITYVVGGKDGERVNAPQHIKKGGRSLEEHLQPGDEYVSIVNAGPQPVSWYWEATKA